MVLLKVKWHTMLRVYELIKRYRWLQQVGMTDSWKAMVLCSVLRWAVAMVTVECVVLPFKMRYQQHIIAI